MVTMVTATNTMAASRRDLTTSIGMLPCHRSSLLRTLLLLAVLIGGSTGATECVGAFDRSCDSGLCFDAIHTSDGTITNGCATKELCIQTGCGLISAANGTELFVCCCENNVCNGKSRGLIQARFQMWKRGNYKTPPRVGHLMADEGRISTRHLQANNTPTESTDLSKTPVDEAVPPTVKRPAAPSADPGATQGIFETTAENVLSAAVQQPVRPSPTDTSITDPSSRRAEDGRIQAGDFAGRDVGQPTEPSASIVHSNEDHSVDSNAIFVPYTRRFAPAIREETSTSTTPVSRATTSTSPPQSTTTTSSTTTTTTTTITTTTTSPTTTTALVSASTSTTPTTTTTNIPTQTTTIDSAERDNVAQPALVNLTSGGENAPTISTPNVATDQPHEEGTETTIIAEVTPTNLILDDVDERILDEYSSPTPLVQADPDHIANASNNASFPWWIIGVLFLGALLLVFIVGSALVVIRERRSGSATLTGNVEEAQHIDPLLTARSSD